MKTIKSICLGLSLVLILAVLALALASLGVGDPWASPARAVAAAPPKGGKCCFVTIEKSPRKIVCDELVVKSKDGKHSVVISATQGGVGMWISGPKGRCVSLVSKDGYTGPWIGIHKDGESACSWGVQLDKDGNPFVQSIVDGKVKHTPVK